REPGLRALDLTLIVSDSFMALPIARGWGRSARVKRQWPLDQPRRHKGIWSKASPAGALGVTLSFAISALRVLRPVQRQALAQKPFAEIGAADRTGRDRAAIWVEAERRAVDRTPGNECIKIICGLRATTVLQTVLAAEELAAFRRVDTPEPDADSMKF